MNRLKSKGCLNTGRGLQQHPRADKVCDSACLLLHKRKDGGAQQIYDYTIHEQRHKIGLDTLRNVSISNAIQFSRENNPQSNKDETNNRIANMILEAHLKDEK